MIALTISICALSVAIISLIVLHRMEMRTNDAIAIGKAKLKHYDRLLTEVNRSTAK